MSDEAVLGSEIAEMKKLAHAFLDKPFNAEALLATASRLLHPAAKP